MRNQAHWRSDIIAGWLLGSGLGFRVAHREVPLPVQILPGGISVGFPTGNFEDARLRPLPR
jgi:hypothetical protein